MPVKNNMKRVYLMRHGQTHANKNSTFQGADELLTDEGIMQANRAARRLQNIDFDTLIVSDYTRTQMTAEPITELTGIKPELSPLFREEKRPTSRDRSGAPSLRGQLSGAAGLRRFDADRSSPAPNRPRAQRPQAQRPRAQRPRARPAQRSTGSPRGPQPG